MVVDGFLGFGQRVSGGGDVTAVRVDTLDALTKAIADANTAPGPTVILVTGPIVAEEGERTYELSGTALTIYGNPASSLEGIGFVVTEKADDILFRNLTFRSFVRDDQEAYPDDTIVFRTRRNPGDKGFLIDHCTFEPVPDMSVQTKAEDSGDEWLLLSIANCRFDGEKDWEDQGSIEISGYDDGTDRIYDVRASVLRCYLEGPRRRSPRSSRGTFVHAYDNVVRNWGVADDDDQSNGMAAGAGGRLAVIANYFNAGKVRATIDARPAIDDDPPGLVQLGHDTNVYEDDAEPLYPNLRIDEQYAPPLIAPVPEPMTPALADAVMGEAGATLGAWGTAVASATSR